MASERPVVLDAAQASASSISVCGIRTVTWGSLPPVGGRPRPRFFGATFIDFFINMVVPNDLRALTVICAGYVAIELIDALYA